jgi:hypothetical protein
MNNTLWMKVAAPAAVVTLGLLGAAPVAAQTTVPPSETAVLTVTKTVDGTAPADAEFVLHIRCLSDQDEEGAAPRAVDYDEDITFGSTGGSEEFEFFDVSSCEITEVDDGGADSNSGPVSIDILEPIAYSAEIINTFDPAVSTTSTAAPAPAVEATAAFTG